MAKISSYTTDSTVTGADLLIGTDTGNSNATANYTVNSIMSFIKSQSSVSVISVLSAASYVQQGVDAVNTAKDVSFGNQILNSYLSMDADGLIQFQQAGTYLINGYGTVARTGSSGLTILLFRAVLQGAQVGQTKGFEIDKTDIWIPYETTSILTVNQYDSFKFQISCENHADGILTPYTPLTSGWDNLPSAAINIWKIQFQ